MPTIVQINSFDSGSTGKIAIEINKEAEKYGFRTYFLFGRYWKDKHNLPANHIKIGNTLDCFFHLIIARLFDAIGLGSIYSTKKLIKFLKQVNPDIIHLHNIHGYYINYPLLFKYLSSSNIPVVWTLHDCWTFTGHCSHFDLIGCDKWKTCCLNCPQKQEYPKSIWLSQSKRNFNLKKSYFTSIKDHLVLVPVSYWLNNLLDNSFLKDVKKITIHNGIDIKAFQPTITNHVIEKYGLKNSTVLLGVASPWTARKGLIDFLKLRDILPERFKIIMVGLSSKQISDLPKGIIGIERTQSIKELAELYSVSTVFVNTTYEDNYPTVNLEALSCGTPVITYQTGGSPESVCEGTGYVLKQGDINGIINAVSHIEKMDREQLRFKCRERAVQMFDKQECFKEYVNLYNELLNK